jgi:hypothetical protein
MANTNYLLSLNQEMWEEAADRAESLRREFSRVPEYIIDSMRRTMRVRNTIPMMHHCLESNAYTN